MLRTVGMLLHTAAACRLLIGNYFLSLYSKKLSNWFIDRILFRKPEKTCLSTRLVQVSKSKRLQMIHPVRWRDGRCLSFRELEVSSFGCELSIFWESLAKVCLGIFLCQTVDEFSSDRKYDCDNFDRTQFFCSSRLLQCSCEVPFYPSVLECMELVLL